MQPRQLQVAVDPIQDRLLLRVATPRQEEVRVHFTRRFLRELWPALAGKLGGQPAAAPAGGDRALSGDFEQPYRNDDPVFPLGSMPLLPAEASLEPAGDGRFKLTLRELKERSFTLDLDANLLQALCAMLRASSDQAGWDLALDYGAPRPLAGASPATPTHLH